MSTSKACTALFLLAFPLLLAAQPPNDECFSPISLGIAPSCLQASLFTNANATASDIGFPSCFAGGTAQRDVWFTLTSSDTILNYTISVKGRPESGNTPISNPQLALYRGSCSGGLAELACAAAIPGADSVRLSVDGLTPNVTYFLRVDSPAETAGAFGLCIREKAPTYLVSGGGSSECSGILYDSGGPAGDYTDDEDHTFTICPDDPGQCILFTLDNYFIEPPGEDESAADLLTFYDSEEADEDAIIGELGGGVCYQVSATSGCLTIRFRSDSTVTFQGFEGRWSCSNDCEIAQPIRIEQDIPNEALIDFVSTPTTTATVSSINCSKGAYGLFRAGEGSDLGLERGILLTTGDLDWAVGPNWNNGGGNPFANNGSPGDPELDYLSRLFGADTLSENACVVELDVFAATDELTFEYIFGSEEYLEYVGEEYNDIFAFFISGPGIEGDPNLRNQLNIAVLPNGQQTPVQINSVNNTTNWEYYRNNNNGIATQYDGLTTDYLGSKKSLTARASVLPCNTYHLKFAIADRADPNYDSGVFIAELQGGAPRLRANFRSGIDYLVEGCADTPDEVEVSINNPAEDTLKYQVIIGGTAERGVDYLLEMPASIILPPGETQVSFPLQALSDNETEPLETIRIQLTNDFGCGAVLYTELEIQLTDQLRVEINGGRDTAYVCPDSTAILSVEGAAAFFWSPASLFDDPLSAMPSVRPPASQWVRVEGSLIPCTAMDSVFLQLAEPILEIEGLGPLAICQGDSLQLRANNNVGNTNLQWSPAEGLSDPTSASPLAFPQQNTEYVATINVTGCIARDTLAIDVSPFDFPELAPDTTLCQNYGLPLAEAIPPDSTTTSFQWSPSSGLDNDTIAGPLAFPEETTTYQLIARSANGGCTDTASVTVTVLPADVEIQGEDTLEICLGESALLTATTTTGMAEGLRWSSTEPLSGDSSLVAEAAPEVSAWYYASYTLGECTVFDSLFIRVDSLPGLLIEALPEKEAYCQGEIVQLVSTTYEPADFSDIQHQWQPAIGFESPDSLWNLVISTQDTTLYQRITANRACRDTADILINVIQPPIARIIPADTTICQGESVLFRLEIEGEYESVAWQGDGLSCTDCLNPLATPGASTSYTVSITADGCESPVSANIEVRRPPAVQLNPLRTTCEGSAFQLNFASDPFSTYTWTSTDPNFGTVTGPQPIVFPASTTTYFLLADNGICPPVETQLTVAPIPQPGLSLNLDSATICRGNNVTLSATVSNPGPEDAFFWSNSLNNQTFTSPEITVSPGASAVYRLRFTSGGGCDTLYREVAIEVAPLPVLSPLPDTAICFGDSIQLNFSADSMSTYSWASNDPAFPGSMDPLLTVAPSQTSFYNLTVDNGICNPVAAEILVEVVQASNLRIDGPGKLVCTGDSIRLRASVDGGGSADQFLWRGDDGSMASGPSVAFTPSTSTTYTLTNFSGAGCDTLTAMIEVPVETGVSVELASDPASFSTALQGDPVVLNAVVTPPLQAETYWLLNGDTVRFGIDELSYEDVLIFDPSVYTFIAQTRVGCSDSASVAINVEPPSIGVPNVFTPNGDGQNDFFSFVLSGNIESVVEFQVFNRWGQQVFAQSDIPTGDFIGWDGAFNGQPQPSDTYFYMIRLRRYDGQVEERRGDVTLLR